jgi:hypothetical protein
VGEAEEVIEEWLREKDGRGTKMEEDKNGEAKVIVESRI